MGGASWQVRAYEANGETVDASRFVGIACDPARSVVVEACAGSGKTWLLVARMLRLLLAGNEPSELLAITFTRKAAQEMRQRLHQLLHDLALKPDQEVRSLLAERGVPADQIPRLLPEARTLYERVLASPQGLSIDTFHGWFARLIQIAPLSAGVPQSSFLAESTATLLNDAYVRFMHALKDNSQGVARDALANLYGLVGDWNAKRLLMAFVEKRTAWWAAVQRGQDAPLAGLRALCGKDAMVDARMTLWEDEPLRTRLENIAWLLAQGTRRNQERAAIIREVVAGSASIDNFHRLLDQFRDEKGAIRGNDHARGRLLAAIEQHLGVGAAGAFAIEFAQVGEAVQHLQRRSLDRQVLALNEALFQAGQVLLEHYQSLKAEQRVIDFDDLEWHAYRLLTDSQTAAYLQSRLDARYRHILLDEFQDTNPLQWRIVRGWLDAYGGDTQKPTVFVVGDPKQSIYRFRRAEPRIFAAARDELSALGADVLRTSQTRRNSTEIIRFLNRGFADNPIYAEQTTLGLQGGAAWRLPLIRVLRSTEDQEPSRFGLRDPLLTPREEEEDARRLEEGRMLARTLFHALDVMSSRRGAPARWSDVMLLVRRRQYLRAYETALREAGIPFVSDKRGGLLQSLEVADLMALLNFLVTPGDDKALAHVLKSPMFGVGDEALVSLALRTERGWWRRLQAWAREDGPPSIQYAVGLLESWLLAAPRLPVHDLLDLVMHQGDLVTRYARTASAVSRPQVLGNLDAFIELALSLDSGRYPSLPKFIDALAMLGTVPDNEAPGEASVNASVDAVRLLTIHGAKGLEAPIVAVVDANHSQGSNDTCGILCEWPQDADAPTHFSCFGRESDRGAARESLFREEEALQTQEDWNLLYVAATRASEILIVSGIAGTRGMMPDGVIEGSWYHRLSSIPELVPPEPAKRMPAGTLEPFLLPVFSPPLLSEAAPVAEPLPGAAVQEGIALHGLLERVTQVDAWPPAIPDSALLTRWLRCSPQVAKTVREQALKILLQPQLERFFNPAYFLYARNEMEVMHGDEMIRIDRVVVTPERVWIIDYKRDLLDSERSAYRSQLQRYVLLLQEVFTGRQLEAALITADGRLWKWEQL